MLTTKAKKAQVCKSKSVSCSCKCKSNSNKVKVKVDLSNSNTYIHMNIKHKTKNKKVNHQFTQQYKYKTSLMLQQKILSHTVHHPACICVLRRPPLCAMYASGIILVFWLSVYEVIWLLFSFKFNFKTCVISYTYILARVILIYL